MNSTISAERVCKVLEGMYLLDMHEIPKNKFADKVYMWCHIIDGNTCENPHEDWVKEFLEFEKALLDEMRSPAEKRRELHKDEDDSLRMADEGCPNC